KRNLPLVRVIADSFRRHHPEVPFYVLLTDQPEGYFDPAAEPFIVLTLDDLDVGALWPACFTYPRQNMEYAATPSLLAHLLNLHARVVFIKQESLVVGDLGYAFEALKTNSVVLTPHLLSPPEDVERELNVLLAGTYNLGFLGLAAGDETSRFLAWWQERLIDHCVRDVARGTHFEQRWVDLAPGFFRDVFVARDPGANVGHWSFPERVVEVHGDRVTVDGAPARLMRFSGYDPDEPQKVSRYSRMTTADIGQAALVFDRYRELLMAAGYETARHWPYAFDRFDNGAPILECVRTMYTNLDDQARSFGNPFQTGRSNSFFRWLMALVDGQNGPFPVTRFWYGIYKERPDLRQAFPDALGADREA
ncbi:hypothetical protein LCGC14_3006530, partial [marine sediment metagenome]